MSDHDAALSELRREVDEIDSRMHDLLMRRTALAERIRAAKTSDSAAMRPGREAEVLRRLVHRHRGEFPKPVLVRIWREIFSVFTALQGPFAVAVYAPPRADRLSRLARDHFGSLTAYSASETTTGVIRAVSEGEATVGVLPLPGGGNRDLWWRFLARNDPSVPRIIARLPFVGGGNAAGASEGALAIALSTPDQSAADRSFLIVEARRELSRSAFRGLLQSAGLEVEYIEGWSDPPDRWLHVVGLSGQLAQKDPRLRRLIGHGDDVLRQAWAIGGYAVPLSTADLVSARDGAAR